MDRRGFLLGLGLLSATLRAAETRPRARDLGLRPGVYPTGPLNAITDVSGVRVGHVTLIEGDNVRTGVTAIVPHGGNVFQDKVSGGVFVGSGTHSGNWLAPRRCKSWGRSRRR